MSQGRERHKNKYAHESRVAQKMRRVERGCLYKKAWNSPEEAVQKGQAVYHCEYCGKWHRTSKKATY